MDLVPTCNWQAILTWQLDYYDMSIDLGVVVADFDGVQLPCVSQVGLHLGAGDFD
jgi:hypothetical protein